MLAGRYADAAWSGFARHRVRLRVNPALVTATVVKKPTRGRKTAKHGIWHSDLPAALAVMQKYRLKLVGIHMQYWFRRVDYTIWSRFAARWYAVLECGQDVRRFRQGGGL